MFDASHQVMVSFVYEVVVSPTSFHQIKLTSAGFLRVQPLNGLWVSKGESDPFGLSDAPNL